MGRCLKKLKSAFFDRRVSNKLLICYLVTIFLPLTVFFALFLSRVNGNFQKEYRAEKVRVLQQAASAFGSVTAQAEYITSTLESNSAAMLYLVGGYRNASDEVYAMLRDIDPLFERFTISSEIVREVWAYRYRTSSLTATRHVLPVSEAPYGEETLRSLRHGDRLVELKAADGRIWLEIVMPVLKDGFFANVGACRGSMDITELVGGVSLLSSEQFVLESGGTYLRRQPDGEAEPLTREEFEALPGVRTTVEVEELNLRLHVLSTKTFFEEKELFLQILLFLLALCLLSLIYYAIPVVLVRPIVQLSKHMNGEADSGRVRPVEIPHGGDEVGELVESFNRMAVKNEQLTDQVYRGIIARQRAEYYALQSQIKPHFVFNVLQRISMLVYLDRKEEINSLMQKFSDFLRYSMNNNAEAVTLAGELLHAENYLDILRDTVRIGYSKEVGPGVDPDAVLCPQFILQPIVENAVKYHSRSRVNVAVRVVKEGEAVLVSVWNDGPPIPEETLRGIREKMEGSAPEILEEEGGGRSGIGLVNVNTRLRYFYGPDCGLRIGNAPGGGVEVVLRLKQAQADFRRGGYEGPDR